ncbi:MAG: aldo/keto reductase [Sphaerochaetaceae bacterium]|jgi:aryl-alcohol dehydrogenase-like predicted oxidoreductase
MKRLPISALIPSASRIALGCDHYGETISQETAFRLLDLYVSNGGNLLDTAMVYGQKVDEGPSTSEPTIGQWLKDTGMRKKVAIATKGGHPHIGRMHDSRLDWKSLSHDINRSLEQLGTDHVDLWFLHRDDPRIGVDEIIDMLDEFVTTGLTFQIGASNWSHERIAEANEYAKRNGRHMFTASEIQWSLAVCTPDQWGDDTIVCMDDTAHAWYRKQQIPVFCYASQAKGLFSKIIAGEADTLSERARTRFLTDENLERVDRCAALSKELGVSPAALCVAYITSQNIPTVAIVGSSKVDQLQDTLSMADLELTQEQIAFLEGRES